ncbi:MAG: trypsin-like peptidase domain-containing protein [Dethiobacter sp.]|jgi:serine protease Do|nr:trypsin-like peptidase domain-containing protein [Dethiobacter sp.]
MDFFHGFSQKPRKIGLISIVIAALFGAVLGGGLVAMTMVRYLDQSAQAQPDPIFLPPPEEVRFSERDLPEYQNTAIVRAAEHVVPTVVGITNKALTYDFIRGRQILTERATGTGVIIDSSGYIVTNNHVIDKANEISVTLSSGEELLATLIGADAATDLAVIKIEKTNLPVATFGDSDTIKVGEMAIAIGNPLGLAFSQSVTVGYISAKQRTLTINEHNFTFIQTDAAINDGNSGGPLVNLGAEVIGINTAKIKISGVEGMGFAIPANTVKTITRDLIIHGRIIRPWIGIYWGGDINQAMASQLQLPVNYGVLIQDVVKGGPADNAGIMRGDVIVEMNGKKVDTFNEMRRIIFNQNVGDSFEIVFYRGQQKHTATIKLAELPARTD